MELPVQTECKQVSVDALYETYSPQEVLGYCQHCNNYGRNHSCPDFDFDTKALLDTYSHVWLILTHVPTEALKKNWDWLSKTHFDSMVGDLHMKNDAGYDPIAAVSMQAFNKVKDRVSDLLLDLEKELGGYSSPPGSCTRCETCTKVLGKPCVYPQKLRHSLESLGFRVNDIYEAFFGIELEWTEGELPEAFHSCSALFISSNRDLSHRLNDVLTKEMKSITI